MHSLSTTRPFSAPIQGLPTRAKRVLVVEDEWIVARDLSDLLYRLGHIPVGHAGNASDAIRLAAAKNPDLILMDIQLPGSINGVAAAAEIARRHAAPLIYITANSNVFLNGEAEMVAPYICVAKPFSEQAVQAAIEIAAI
jgi:CheY-like chemotaxis protein